MRSRRLLATSERSNSMDDVYWAPGEPLDGPERWYPLRGYEGTYEASTHGSIRRIAGGPGVKKPMPRLMQFSLSDNGYKTCRLSLDGKAKTFNAHWLIAMTFLGDPPEELREDAQVDHIDGNRYNNSASNLQWVSMFENLRRRE